MIDQKYLFLTFLSVLPVCNGAQGLEICVWGGVSFHILVQYFQAPKILRAKCRPHTQCQKMGHPSRLRTCWAKGQIYLADKGLLVDKRYLYWAYDTYFLQLSFGLLFYVVGSYHTTGFVPPIGKASTLFLSAIFRLDSHCCCSSLEQ